MNEPLTTEHVDFFYRNGYLHIPQLIPPQELVAVQADTLAMIRKGLEAEEELPTYRYCVDALDNNRRCLYRIDRLLYHHGNESFKLLLAYPDLLRAIAQVVGDDHFASTVHSVVFKIPERGYPVPWHQDPLPIYRFPVFNVDIYLDHASPENGTLYVIPESHLGGYQGTPESHGGSPDFIHGWTLGKEADAPGAVPVLAQPGDVLLHSVTVLHGSFWNRSKSLRRTIYFHVDHLEDMRMRPPAQRKQHDYVRAQRHTLEAIELRRQRFPDEQPFAYRPVSPETLEKVFGGDGEA